MRKVLVFAVSIMFILASCATSKVPPGQAKKITNPPPGQVKKATGSKSAAPYAPGQQKNKSKGKKN